MKLIKSTIILAAIISLFSQAKPVSTEHLQNYQYTIDQPIVLKSASNDGRYSEFSFTSFDGQIVYGQISYPQQSAKPYPVLIGFHAMGRSSERWWQDDIGGRKTITQVNKLTEMADKLGYVVIALDARAHAKRKDPNMSLTKIMTALTSGSDVTPYRDMILNTVKDHRVLLDWIQTQPQLDNNKIQVAGYSMGAQLSLLLAAVDPRINDILAIVPPFIEEKELALISPVTLASLLANNRLMLITADADEYASIEQNTQLFDAITSTNKHRVVIAGGHILPKNYLMHLKHWFVEHKQVQ